jgi:hypothetical protein
MKKTQLILVVAVGVLAVSLSHRAQASDVWV